ncbi:hypothetical protein VNO77_28216 [Canavalia gladiata]|uniref:Uncharacterized protein n=1 Tax=Canavalia gladiata TaxID=3824 RepID=A0AAN9Q747_CANGL
MHGLLHPSIKRRAAPAAIESVVVGPTININNFKGRAETRHVASLTRRHVDLKETPTEEAASHLTVFRGLQTERQSGLTELEFEVESDDCCGDICRHAPPPRRVRRIGDQKDQTCLNPSDQIERWKMIDA